MRLDIRADIRDAQRFLKVTKGGVRRAASRAINDSLITVRAEGAREIKAKHPALKIGEIKRKMLWQRATARTLTGWVETTGTPLPLEMFSLGGGAGTRRRLGVRGQVSLTRTNRPLTARMGTKRAQVQYNGRKGFRVLMYGNEVFVRQHPKGRQIRRFRGPSLPGVFRASSPRFKAIAQRRWAAAFPSRMQFEISRAKR